MYAAYLDCMNVNLQLIQYPANFFGVNSKTICKLTVCSYHVTYVFQSESTLYSCLNVKELLALASLAKRLSVRLRTKWLWVRVPMQSLICKLLDILSWRRSRVFIVNLEHISHLVLVFLLLTLSK